MPPLPPDTTPPGDYAFTPSDDRLLFFLRRKIAGEPLLAAVAAHFHDADIYIADPDLVTVFFEVAPAKKGESGPWFFFTHVRPKSSSDSRKSRLVAGGVGTWHSERAPRRVLDGEGNYCCGHSQYFNYKHKIDNNHSKRTEWDMVEFTEDQEASHERVPGGEPQLVLCKIYKMHKHNHSRSDNGSASRPSCSASARKRKASDEVSAPVQAKRRLFDSPAPSLVSGSQEQVSSKDWIAGEATTSQVNIGDTFDWTAWMSNADGGAATFQGKIGDTSGCTALMSKTDGEAATSQQLKIGDTSDFSRFWSEPEASFDLMTGGAPWNCSRANVSDVGGVFGGRDAWSSAVTTSDDTTAAFMCCMPSAAVLLLGESSLWSGSHNIWSC